eukprot:m.95571 g.95571  ORF g.95571 m.95571 type:complete len:360 (-) comp16606_c0_seq1:71-1150(-)
MVSQEDKKKGLANRVLGRLQSLISVTKGCSSPNRDVPPPDLQPDDRQLDANENENDRANEEAETKEEAVPAASPEPVKLQKGKRQQSSPAINTPSGGKNTSKMSIGPRSSSQPVLVKFLPQYVNRLKSQNFTLKEKMTRWVKQSPYALIKTHLPPDDHYVEFPTAPYIDYWCDEFGRSYERLQEEEDGHTPKPRMEIVLERYPKGLHGICCSFDLAPNEDRTGSRTAVHMPRMPGDKSRRRSSQQQPEQDRRRSSAALSPTLPSPLMEGNVRAMGLNMPADKKLGNDGGDEGDLEDEAEDAYDEDMDATGRGKRHSKPHMCPRGITNLSLLPMNFDAAPKRLTLPEITPIAEQRALECH